MAWDRQLVLVQKGVLNPFLVMFIGIKVILLQVVQKARRNCSNSFNVHLRGGELLLAVLDRILEVFQRKHQLQQSFCVQLKRGCILSTFRHVVCFVEDYDAFIVVQSVVGTHRLVQHVVVRHHD